jgi:proline dehydrogenase
MQAQPEISFDDTEIAFAYKSDKELKQANFLFSVMGKPWLVKNGYKVDTRGSKMESSFCEIDHS